MELSLAGRYGEHRITVRELNMISSERLAEFHVELEKIAIRDGLAVEIDDKVGRGAIVRWWPADEPYPW